MANIALKVFGPQPAWSGSAAQAFETWPCMPFLKKASVAPPMQHRVVRGLSTFPYKWANMSLPSITLLQWHRVYIWGSVLPFVPQRVLMVVGRGLCAIGFW